MSIGEEIVGENSKTSFGNGKTEFQLPVAPLCDKTCSDFDARFNFWLETEVERFGDHTGC